MNVMSSTAATELIALGIQPGEMLLESIQAACRDRDIRNGAVVSGIGTLRTCHMHYIEHTDFPPADRFYRLEKPLELLSVSGIIADGQPHLHIVVSCGDSEVYAGHLEPESQVAYLAEIAILKCNDLAMTRRLDAERHINLLAPANHHG
ncbi:MAG: PPC domain-containing DNA-binding protein [Phycisphaerae bacterium]